jgi:protein-L-isoaspartate(D-aspartate) O-methyltransferase
MNTTTLLPLRFDSPVEEARFNMIEQQIRTWDVLDAKVLDLLGQVPREAFVADAYQGLAFADIDIPIGYGQTMLSPKIEGRILQTLSIKNTDRILEIGTGSGYLTALLAKLGKHVTSVEIVPQLSELAAKRLEANNIFNHTLFVGDASQGWSAGAPFDVIVFTGSLLVTPSLQVKKLLAEGGRMFVVIGEAPVMQATLIKRVSAESYKHDVVFETCLPALSHAIQPERFEF